MKRLLPILLLVFSVGVGAASIEYKGGTYTGELLNGVPHGQGTFTIDEGPKYVGEWKDGKARAMEKAGKKKSQCVI